MYTDVILVGGVPSAPANATATALVACVIFLLDIAMDATMDGGAQPAPTSATTIVSELRAMFMTATVRAVTVDGGVRLAPTPAILIALVMFAIKRMACAQADAMRAGAAHTAIRSAQHCVARGAAVQFYVCVV